MVSLLISDDIVDATSFTGFTVGCQHCLAVIRVAIMPIWSNLSRILIVLRINLIVLNNVLIEDIFTVEGLSLFKF